MLSTIVQAITETMPVSSSAHLSLFSLLSLEIVKLHLLTAFAATLYFHKTLFKLAKSFISTPALTMVAITALQVLFVLAGSQHVQLAWMAVSAALVLGAFAMQPQFHEIIMQTAQLATRFIRPFLYWLGLFFGAYVCFAIAENLLPLDAKFTSHVFALCKTSTQPFVCYGSWLPKAASWPTFASSVLLATLFWLTSLSFLLLTLTYYLRVTWIIIKQLLSYLKTRTDMSLILAITILQFLIISKTTNEAHKIGLSSITSGIALWIAASWPEKLSLEELTYRHIPTILVLQTVGFLTGFSRLGSALIATRILQFNTQTSWIIAILLGIPLSIGAYFYEAAGTSFGIPLTPALLTVLVALVFYGISRKIPLRAYGAYKVAFGIAYLFLK